MDAVADFLVAPARTLLVYTFHTANSPMGNGVLEAMTTRFPTLHFRFIYACTVFQYVGRLLAEGGRLTHDWQDTVNPEMRCRSVDCRCERDCICLEEYEDCGCQCCGDKTSSIYAAHEFLDEHEEEFGALWRFEGMRSGY